MQKKLLLSYALIFLTLLVVMSLSRPATEKMRGSAIAILAPIWERIAQTKVTLLSSSKEPVIDHSDKIKLTLQEEVQRLDLENQLLNNQLSHLNQLLIAKHHVASKLQNLPDSEIDPTKYETFIQRLKHRAAFKAEALPARVIFRSFDSWNQTLWINVGQTDNTNTHSPVVAKNSPVVVGSSLVGVIDYVGQHQSRVRLLTDPILHPSVRAARGGEQEVLISEHVEALLQTLQRKKIFSLSETEQENLQQLLHTAHQGLQPLKKTWYLAKGELQGSNRFTKRGYSLILKGTGFNYDFDDEEGEGRDLRTGKPLAHSSGSAVPILKVHDVLITTGMDGMFPPGLKVAVVTKVHLLKEGDYFYELEAQPMAGNLYELSLVFVIPPVGYNRQDQELAEK